MRVVVLIPTYNEAQNVRPIVTQVLASECQPDVVVVDDASPDGTADIVRELMADNPRVSVHNRKGKSGLGAAYVDGMNRVLQGDRYDVVVQMDADGSHPPADVDRLVAALEDADLVIGSRYVRGGGVADWPLRRRLLSRGGNTYARLWLRLPVRDLTGGFKAWRAGLLREIALASVRSDGYAFQVETTLRASRCGARVREIPITFKDRTAGASKMNPRIAWEALRILPTLRRGGNRTRPLASRRRGTQL